jgi:hypothetical protein
MCTSKVDAETTRAQAIAEALKASGARSLPQLLSDHEHKARLDKLCAKLEALPKVIKKRRGSDSIQARRHRFGAFSFCDVATSLQSRASAWCYYTVLA